MIAGETSIVREQISPTTAAGDRANSQRAKGLPKVVEGSLPPAKELRICAHERECLTAFSLSLYLSLSLSHSVSNRIRSLSRIHTPTQREKEERSIHLERCV